MFIWPDSIPPGLEYLILATIPLGILVILKWPFAAGIQVLFVLASVAVSGAVARKAKSPFRMFFVVLGAYLASTLASNLALFAWHSLT